MPQIPTNIGKAEVRQADAYRLFTTAKGFIEAYDLTLNPYSGCTFGCSYCYAAFFTRTQQDQDNWGKYVTVKTDLLDLARRIKPAELFRRKIYMATVTDPYQPIERKLELVRELLTIIAEKHREVMLTVQTRSPLVTRDIDLFHQIEEKGGTVNVNMTITTDDDDIRRAFEPNCPRNKARLDAIAQVQSAGIMTHITMTPLLPILDVDQFAADLLNTGVTRFITQDLKLGPGRSQAKFVAGTREEAVQIMADKLQCPKSQVSQAYRRNYLAAEQRLRELLPTLGIGKDGFKPPF